MCAKSILVVQSNLVKSLGNLKAFEHKILVFCVSYVQKESKATETFQVTISDIFKKAFSLEMRLVKYASHQAFKKVERNTALYFAKQRKDGKKSIIMGWCSRKLRW